MRLTIQSKLFLSHFAAILLVSGSAGSYFFNNAVDNRISALQSRLQNSAALVSQGLDSGNLDQIRSQADQDSDLYRRNVAALREFVNANSDIAFIYVMRKLDGKPVFVLDSDLEDPAVPGEVYPHEVPELMMGFLQPSVDSEITTDRWGSFLSGYSPLDAGTGTYLVGIDMHADQVQEKLATIRLAGMLSLAFSVLLAVIFSRMLSRHFTNRIQRLQARVSSIAADQPDGVAHTRGDEIAQLSSAFDSMSLRLDNSHRHIEANEKELRRAHDELEERVAERTLALTRANAKLRSEVEERKRAEARLEALSRTDYLTGILNRRAITRRLEDMISKIEFDHERFCLILIDLDHFKGINDQFGHDVGDYTLKHAVERLINGVRETDLLGRWGGEEFLVVSPATELAEARHLADRLCNNLAGSRVQAGEISVAVTGSFGVTRYLMGESLDACLKRTDDALYEAKKHGRNCIVVDEHSLPDSAQPEASTSIEV